MARLFDDSADFIDIAIGGGELDIGTSEDFWTSVWWRRTGSSSNASIHKTSATSSRQFEVRRVTSNDAFFRHDEGTVNTDVSFGPDPTDGALHNMQAGREGTTIRAWSDGVEKNTDTVTAVLMAVDKFNIGLGIGRGETSEYAFWIGIIPNTSERLAIAKGVSPLYVQRNTLKLYVKVLGNSDPEIDFSGTIGTLALDGAPPKARHPPVQMLTKIQRASFIAASGAAPPAARTLFSNPVSAMI